MNTLEPVEVINRRLLDTWGRFDTTNHPLFRVVYSEDCIEKRFSNYTDEGFALLTPEVRELPKYRQWVQNKYILERLIVVPSFVETDLVDSFSYEPLWVFENAITREALPPKWEAIEIIINQVHSAAAKSVGAKYKDPDILDPKHAAEQRKEQLDGIIEDLFGNETNTGDALAYKEGVSVPRNYERGQ